MSLAIESSGSSGRVIHSDQGRGQSNLNRFDFCSDIVCPDRKRLMARPLAKSLLLLLALGFWILGCAGSLAKGDDPYALNNQAGKLIEQRRYQEAIPIAERAVEAAKRALGPENPGTAVVMINLGFIFEKIGSYARAEPLYQEALRIRQKVRGPEHPDTAEILYALGELYYFMGEYAKAESLYQEALRIRQKVLGPVDPETANSLEGLGVLYEDM